MLSISPFLAMQLHYPVIKTSSSVSSFLLLLLPRKFTFHFYCLILDTLCVYPSIASQLHYLACFLILSKSNDRIVR